MKVVRNLSVPTGNILIGQGDKGLLEFLSLADYGQSVNLNQHKPVQHQTLMPLEEKWVITISTQYGCSMQCKFCDVPKVGPGINATLNDLTEQIRLAKELHPDIITKRLNVHFARMGEPTWNPAVLACAKQIYEPWVHPVVSTMMPRNNRSLHSFIDEWMGIKNNLYRGNAGLQLSINSTDEFERRHMFNGNAHSLHAISAILRNTECVGRKITLNFAVADYQIDPAVLLQNFDPAKYIIKLTPMHKTSSALKNGIETAGDYTDFHPYLHHEEALKAAGYDVLTFIASREEDLGRITCGNAILSGTLPLVEFHEVCGKGSYEKECLGG